MFGGRFFGGTYFGQGVTQKRQAGGGGIGGSGFSPDWIAKMLGQRADEDERRRRDAEEEEIAMLISLGLFD